MFTDLNLTDMETCYKVFRREVILGRSRSAARTVSGSTLPEIIARLVGWRVYECGITYGGRTYEEGKKIGWRDGRRALICMSSTTGRPGRL